MIVLVQIGRAEALVLDPDRAPLELAPEVEILMDPDRSLSLEDLTGATGLAFQSNSGEAVSIGWTTAAVWFRFKLVPKTTDPNGTHWFLEVGKQGIGTLDLYVPMPQDSGEPRYKRIAFGTWQPYPREHIPSRKPVVVLPPVWDSPSYFFLRVVSDISVNFHLRMLRPQGFIQEMTTDHYGFGILFGILLSMILYNLSIFLSLRDRAYLFYVLYIVSLLWYVSLVYGQFEMVFKPGFDGTRLAFFAASGAVWCFGGMFCRLFLNTRVHAPLCDRLIQVGIAVSISVSVLAFAGLTHLAHQLNTALGIVFPSVGILASIRVLQKRYTPAKYFLAAWLILMTGVILYSMGGILIPRSPVTVYTFAVGAGAESLLLSLALAYRIRLLQQEREALRQSETRLRQAVITDSLTGIFNRRFLLEALDNEVRMAESHKTPFSLLMLDVDEFKAFNDTWGHPEGDKVLTALAGVLSGQIREKDCPCRYGGEEFVVILPGAGLGLAMKVAERIRAAFAEMVFQPAPKLCIQVTLCIGVAEFRPGENGQDLIRRADKALYRAKQQGRNRVVSA